MRLELGLCLEGVGECWAAEWCPRGGRGARKSESTGRGKGKGKGRADGDGDAMELDGAEEDDNDASRTTGGDKVGLVAAVFADGSAAILVVPDPTTVRAALGVDDDETAYVKAEPLVRLRVPETGICSVAWGGHEVLAAGCLNGYIAVWRVGGVLRSGQPPDRPPRPTHYFAAHAALVRQLVFVSTPPPHLAARAAHDLDAAPTGIVSVGYDGSAVLSDLREPGGGASVLTHERSALYTVAYSAHTGMAYTLDADDRVKALGLKPSMQGNEGRVTIHRGAIWSIAASPHHATVLSASLDGSAMLSSGVRALRKRRLRGHYLTRMYRLEVEYRTALDPYNPYSVKGGTAPLERSTAAWPAEQAVTAAAWHPAIACAPLCATGTAIGLGRVDWAEGGQTPAAAA
ncbi:hypothetical protein DMC30DRAFT_62850 [Rhodotorula diobovata]|uniref:WD40-repeat-containing domain protein n=1 Tax=Rhodotorula diobovata TaxID=5288 RepID=A0A5C5FN56_9BASI|nr:hypothetical protein DMC30DRAFT_62850 [Rhodotorula diobovata]